MLDLFSGGGGFALGFREAGFHIVLSLDMHPPSIETIRRNHPETRTLLRDIRQTSPPEILQAAGCDREEIDVIAAGVPCQGFSLSNKFRDPDDPRNFLFTEFIRIVEAIRPPIALLENVEGLLRTANGVFREAIADELGRIGYEVQIDVLNAADYGVPQRRERVFFLATKPGLRVSFPPKTHYPIGLLTKPNYVTVWDAIADLPPVGPGESRTEYEMPPQTEYQREMRRRSDGVLHNHMAPRHPPATVDKIAAIKPGEPMYPAFRQRIRLHPDDVSPTIVAGGVRPQFHYGHPTQPRGLTVRERCRLMSFPDDYVICGGVVQGRVQTGNAVPPLLAQRIAERIRGGLESWHGR